MTSFLFYLAPATGHVYPLVPTLKELLSRGHDLSVWCAPREAALLADLGIRSHAVDPEIVACKQVPWQPPRTPMEVSKAGLRFMGTFLKRAPLEAADLRRALATESPDAVVVDGSCGGAGAAAEASGLPWAWVGLWPMGIASRDVPPPGLGLAPRSGLLGRLRDGAARSVERQFWRPVLEELNRVRADVGVRPVASMSDMWSNLAPLTAIYVAEPLEYHRSDWPPSVRLVGPGVWSPPAAPPAWLSDVSAPLVLVSCSTEWQGDESLATTAMEALADEDVYVVVTTAAANVDGVRVPPNARVERFVPHGALMDRVACVVCAGGAGTVHAALLSGVPVCVVPFGRDQPEVARRVVAAGVGTRLPAPRLRPDRLRDAVRAAMGKRDRAREVGRQLARMTPAVAADAFEELNAAHRSTIRRPG